MVGFCHWHIPTFIITDIFPPWWDFVMVGICWVTMMMMMNMWQSWQWWCSWLGWPTRDWDLSSRHLTSVFGDLDVRFVQRRSKSNFLSLVRLASGPPSKCLSQSLHRLILVLSLLYRTLHLVEILSTLFFISLSFLFLSSRPLAHQSKPPAFSLNERRLSTQCLIFGGKPFSVFLNMEQCR